MKIKKRILVRLCLTLWSFLFLGVFFQNCGQAGDIVLASNVPEEPSEALNAPPPTTAADPVTLISNPSILINEGRAYTKSAHVTLLSETVGAEEMIISNSPDCSSENGWIAFSRQTAWVLSSENSSVSVYAKFRKKGAPETACVSASIVHDNTPPVVNVTQPAPKQTSLARVQIGFEVTDGAGSGIAETFCLPSNGPEVRCDNMVVFNGPLSETMYTATMRAVDKAGNQSLPVTDFFIVDRTAPVITINGPTGIIAEANPKFMIDIVESNTLKQVMCRLVPLETEYKDCSSLNAQYTNLASGIYKLEVYASDWANNQATANRSYENDLSVPSVTITESPLALGNSKNVSFKFTGVSGMRPITKFNCSLDGVAAPNCASPISYANLADKEYVFSVVGINAANVASAPQSYTFKVDTTPPMISIVSAPTGRIHAQSVTIALDASDLNGLKYIQCNLNGVITDCSTKSITYNNLPDQNNQYVFSATATDGAGNVKSTAPISWVIDNTPDSSILASMQQNPVMLDEKGKLNVTIVQVYDPSYRCVKVSNNAVVSQGTISASVSSYEFVVSEDIRCDITGKDKLAQPISKSVLAEVNCGNKLKENGKCVDFRCLSIEQIPYKKNLIIPARNQQGVCYAMKIFNPISNSSSGLTTTIDNDVLSRNHDTWSGNRNPYSMGSDLLNFVLQGPRVVKLSGGANATSPIKVDNYVLVGLYPSSVTPIPAHYSAQGTSDSAVTDQGANILYKNAQVPLKSFGSSGTATVTPLDIVRYADTNLNYMLDIRALDCGGSRELSAIWVLFQ